MASRRAEGAAAAQNLQPAPLDPAVSKQLRDIIERASGACGKWRTEKMKALFGFLSGVKRHNPEVACVLERRGLKAKVKGAPLLARHEPGKGSEVRLGDGHGAIKQVRRQFVSAALPPGI